jgi:hypothetical protein
MLHREALRDDVYIGAIIQQELGAYFALVGNDYTRLAARRLKVDGETAP